MSRVNNYDYVISASENGYSSITTIAGQGSLVPTYPNQKLISQSSSLVTLMIAPQGEYSLVVQTTNVNNQPLPNVLVYIKGGYKMYTARLIVGFSALLTTFTVAP